MYYFGNEVDISMFSLEYRQKLRDLPKEDGAPWDGGGEETPWPINPVK